MQSEAERCAEHEKFRKIDAAFRAGDLSALRAAVDNPDDVPNGPMPLAIGPCLEYAIYHSPLPFIRTLLEIGAEAQMRTRIDACESAAEMARQTGLPEISELIALAQSFAAGTDVNALDRHGQTALMRAAHNGQEELVGFLIGHGAALDHTAKYHLSALMLAVIGGHAGIVRKLVQAGANASLRGSGAPGFNDKTARDLALAQGRSDMADLLRPGS